MTDKKNTNKTKEQKIKARTNNQITLFDNVIVNDGHITIFYMVNLYNYSVYKNESIQMQIDALYNFLNNLESTISNMRFSLFRFSDITTPNRYFEDFITTVRLWDQEFTPSETFKKNITYLSNSYCMLAINLDKNTQLEVGDMSVKEIAKTITKQVVDYFAAFKQQNVDKERIKDMDNMIINQGQNLIKPVPEQLLLKFIIKRIYPSYDIVIPDNDYEVTKTLLSYFQQEFKPYFNYFTMSNSGVEYFNLPVRETYGTILDIVEFPNKIVSENFDLSHQGLIVNCKLLKKDHAKLMLKRKREDIKFEEESALNTNSSDAAVELEDYSDLAETALAALSIGKRLVEGDMHILILANSLEALNKYRYNLITELRNRDIIATFNSQQALTYVNSYIKMRPQDYPFLWDLRYPLSFRLNKGIRVGDSESEYTSPVIGEEATSAAALHE